MQGRLGPNPGGCAWKGQQREGEGPLLLHRLCSAWRGKPGASQGCGTGSCLYHGAGACCHLAAKKGSQLWSNSKLAVWPRRTEGATMGQAKPLHGLDLPSPQNLPMPHLATGAVRRGASLRLSLLWWGGQGCRARKAAAHSRVSTGGGNPYPGATAPDIITARALPPTTAAAGQGHS